MAGDWLLLFGRVSENLLIMVVEAGQEMEGPSGRSLHRVRVLIVGRWPADADSPDATTGTPVTDAGVINAVATTAGDGDDAADPVVADLPLRQRRYFLPL